MPELTFDIPESLLSRVSRIAKRNQRSVNEEIVRMLDWECEREALLEQIRRHREEMRASGVLLTEEFIHEAINEGRR